MKTNLGKSMTDEIYDYLFDMILSLQIKPGDRIPEAKIAGEFDVSRTPIREALRQLANSGIINMYPKRYAEVAEFDEEKVRQIGFTRIALDLMSVKLAIYYGSNAEYQEMQRLADLCYEAAKAKDVANRIKLDSAFHLQLCRISKNESLIDMLTKLFLQIEFLQASRYVRADRPEDQYETHCSMVKALMDRDEEEMTRIILDHDIKFHSISSFPKEFFRVDF